MNTRISIVINLFMGFFGAAMSQYFFLDTAKLPESTMRKVTERSGFNNSFVLTFQDLRTEAIELPSVFNFQRTDSTVHNSLVVENCVIDHWYTNDLSFFTNIEIKNTTIGELHSGGITINDQPSSDGSVSHCIYITENSAIHRWQQGGITLNTDGDDVDLRINNTTVTTLSKGAILNRSNANLRFEISSSILMQIENGAFKGMCPISVLTFENNMIRRAYSALEFCSVNASSSIQNNLFSCSDALMWDLETSTDTMRDLFITSSYCAVNCPSPPYQLQNYVEWMKQYKEHAPTTRKDHATCIFAEPEAQAPTSPGRAEIALICVVCLMTCILLLLAMRHLRERRKWRQPNMPPRHQRHHQQQLTAVVRAQQLQTEYEDTAMNRRTAPRPAADPQIDGEENLYEHMPGDRHRQSPCDRLYAPPSVPAAAARQDTGSRLDAPSNGAQAPQRARIRNIVKPHLYANLHSEEQLSQ